MVQTAKPIGRPTAAHSLTKNDEGGVPFQGQCRAFQRSSVRRSPRNDVDFQPWSSWQRP